NDPARTVCLVVLLITEPRRQAPLVLQVCRRNLTRAYLADRSFSDETFYHPRFERVQTASLTASKIVCYPLFKLTRDLFYSVGTTLYFFRENSTTPLPIRRTETHSRKEKSSCRTIKANNATSTT